MFIIEWLNTNSGAVQAIAVALLVIVTAVYAWRTHAMSEAAKRQAAASVQMAEEMKASRFEALRPIIALELRGLAPRDENLGGSFMNRGSGPALNLVFYLTHPKIQFGFRHDAYTLIGVGETHEISFPTQDFDFNNWAGFAINCEYQDVYRRHFRSSLRFEAHEQRRLEVFQLEEGEEVYDS